MSSTRSFQHNVCHECGRNDVKLYRKYGSILRQDEIYCGQHLPCNRNWIVPLVEDTDGSVWGYTSVPQEAMDRWENLPDTKEEGSE